jgi:hypothetical protein
MQYVLNRGVVCVHLFQFFGKQYKVFISLNYRMLIILALVYLFFKQTKISTTIYILRVAGDDWYVGKTDNFQKRMEEL